MFLQKVKRRQQKVQTTAQEMFPTVFAERIADQTLIVHRNRVALRPHKGDDCWYMPCVRGLDDIRA